MASLFVSWLGSLGGTVHGHFYKAPPDVDLAKSPGETRIRVKPLSDTLQVYLTGTYFFGSPNLIWFLLAVVQWALFPLDINGIFSWKDLIVKRITINVITCVLYYGYWHITIPFWCSRPFSQRQRPLFSQKVLHNIFYTSLGAMQWGLTETVFIYGYKSGYLTDSNQTFPSIILWCLAVPLIRDVHFYLCHRFLHIRFVYKYIHAVHHRNTDTEPFSGMCMHPVEHFYYFTCYGPIIWFSPVSPFLVTWMGVHVTLSPVGSHSGYEDHWASQLYHYLHHRYYECNYGPSGPFYALEQWCGTFCDKLEPGANEKLGRDPKATLAGVPEHKTYLAMGVVLPCVALWYSIKNGTGDWDYRVVSLWIASAPLLAAATLHAFSYRKSSIWKHYMAPFHEEALPLLVVHAAIGGVVACILPAYSLIAMLLHDK